MGTFKELAPSLWNTKIGRPFPLLPGEKKAFISGVHGRNDPEITQAQIKGWMAKYPEHIPGWIPREGILIIDIDQHDDKHGARELAKALGLDAKGLWGLLEGTAHVTGRPDGSKFHGHWYFRVPDDFEWAKRYPTHPDGSFVQGVEIIGPGRRGFYVVAPGAVHPETGQVYRIDYHEDGVTAPSSLEGMSYLVRPLPEPLVALLRGEEPKTRTQGHGEVWDALSLIPEGKPTEQVQAVLDEYLADPERKGTAHATVLYVQLTLINLAERGHQGVPTALECVRDTYEALRPDRVGEFERYLDGASIDVERIRRGVETGDFSLGGKVTAIPKASSDALKDEFTDVKVGRWLLADFEARGHPCGYNDAYGWMGWDGKKWRMLSSDRVRQNALRSFEAWVEREDIEHIGDTSDTWSARRAQLRQLLTSRKISAVLTNLPAMAHIEPAFFDRHHWLLNCQNGVVDLRTGVLSEHDPAFGFTKITSVAYFPEATDARWDQIKEALSPDEVEYLLARLGQACTGFIPEDDKVCFLVGGGANGKTTLMTPVVAALGTFAGLVRQELLIGDKSQHSEVKMALQGLRLAFLDETAEAYLNPHRLKNIVGVDSITARHLYKSEVTFDATHTLIVNTNYPPKVTETDRGTWRRLEQIHFNKTFGVNAPAVRGIRQAAKTSKAMHRAVLAELVRNAVRVAQNEMLLPTPPATVVKSTNAWREENDTLGQFVAEKLEVAPGFAVPVRDLAEEFNRWQGQGCKPVTPTTVSQRLGLSETLPDGFVFVTDRILSSQFDISQSIYTARVGANWRGTAWVNVRFKESS